MREFVFRESFREAKFVLNCSKPDSLRDSRRWAADVPPCQLLQTMESQRSVHMIVVGGATGKGQFLPGIGSPVTRSVEPYLP